MQPVHVPSSPRALLDRPQRLGLVPTWWFWNDPERYRLALPLVLLLSLPLIPLTFFLVIRFQLHFLLIAVSSTFPPYVALGLIERHIRSELRRRELAGAEVGEALDQASPPDLITSPSGRRLYWVLAAFGGVATAVALGQVWGALAAALTVLILALLIAAARHLSPRTPVIPGPSKAKHLRPESSR